MQGAGAPRREAWQRLTLGPAAAVSPATGGNAARAEGAQAPGLTAVGEVTSRAECQKDPRSPPKNLFSLEAGLTELTNPPCWPWYQWEGAETQRVGTGTTLSPASPVSPDDRVFSGGS
jgi:hypothetical protein